MPGGGSLDLPDRIENTAAFDGAGGTDKHDFHSDYKFDINARTFPES
jgi:hypothetical protein